MVIPPDIISEETSNDMMVPEGGAAKLVCKARGYPKPDIVWKREDGAEIISRAGPGKTKSKEFYFARQSRLSLESDTAACCDTEQLSSEIVSAIKIDSRRDSPRLVRI